MVHKATAKIVWKGREGERRGEREKGKEAKASE